MKKRVLGKLLSLSLAAGIAGVPVAAMASGNTDVPVTDGTEQSLAQAYICVEPDEPAHGITVAQFLAEYAADSDAWVGIQSDSDAPAADDALVCTGMWLNNVNEGEAKSPEVIIVRGDVLQHGRRTLSQLVRLAALIRSDEPVDELTALAGDLNGDGTISLSDLCEAARPFNGLLSPDSKQVVDRMQATDVLYYISASTYQTESNQKWYRPVLDRRNVTLSLPERYREWLDAAAASLSFSNVVRVDTDFDVPSWPLLASIATNCKDNPDGMRDALMAAVNISVTPKREQDGLVLVVSSRPVDPNTLFYSFPQLTPFALSTSYAYLSTVFDESMNERRGIGLPELEPLLFPIEHPSRYYVGDCWYLPRDQGARKHTGTDINAPRGTNLLACVDGTIIGNGWDNVAGNYIVLRGSDGTQYHYYHMVELSDVPIGTEVRMGDVIGHVGSTGNSRANHLHFTIITTGGQYVNPVSYLQRAQTATDNGSIRPS